MTCTILQKVDFFSFERSLDRLVGAERRAARCAFAPSEGRGCVFANRHFQLEAESEERRAARCGFALSEVRGCVSADRHFRFAA